MCFKFLNFETESHIAQAGLELSMYLKMTWNLTLPDSVSPVLGLQSSSSRLVLVTKWL